jgi:dihydrofolate reductase/thymidylate synthase
MVKVSLIAAFTKCKNGKLGIGYENKLPWNVPEDLQHFKKMTENKTVVMGRKTYESIGKALPNRNNIVITRDKYIYDKDIKTSNSVYDLIVELEKDTSKNEIFIIGGGEIYKEFLSYTGFVTNIILTEIKYDELSFKNNSTLSDSSTFKNKESIKCDTYFPPLLSNFILENYTIYKKSVIPEYYYRMLYYSNTDITYKEKYIYNLNYHTSNKTIELKRNADDEYNNLIKNIMKNGNLRSDRSGVGTVSLFGQTMRFDISDGNAPLLTTKRVAWKTAIEEMLWMLSGSINSKKLEEKNIKIWRGHTSREFLDSQGFKDYPEGKLPYGYGHQIRNAGGDTFNCHSCNEPNKIEGTDQLIYIENQLKTNPFSRRILWNLWTANQMNKVPLQPCHIMVQFYVEEIDNVKFLSAMVTMRSNDLGCGNPFNIFNYTALVYIMAMKCNMKPKELIFSIGDAHIYNNHLNQLTEQISRKIYSKSILHLDNSIFNTKWENLDISQFDVVGYFHNPSIILPMNV